MNWKHMVAGVGGFLALIVLVAVMSRVFEWHPEDAGLSWDFVIGVPAIAACLIVFAMQRRGR